MQTRGGPIAEAAPRRPEGQMAVRAGQAGTGDRKSTTITPTSPLIRPAPWPTASPAAKPSSCSRAAASAAAPLARNLGFTPRSKMLLRPREASAQTRPHRPPRWAHQQQLPPEPLRPCSQGGRGEFTRKMYVLGEPYYPLQVNLIYKNPSYKNVG